jgi:16S rRNA (uracil1498-N3)-methyltransferase
VVERDDRSPVATFHLSTAFSAGGVFELSESAAHHARVKRLTVGDAVRLTDGHGAVGIGDLSSLEKRRAVVTVTSVKSVPAPTAIHLRVPIGDRDRMLMLAEKATELGIASWQAVRFRRSMSVSPRGEGEAFGAKVEARMISALEQSGGAWLPRRLPDCGVDAIDVARDAARVLLDVGGEPLLRVAGARPTALLFGPEGGVEPDEREILLARGWTPARLADTVLRFETAGIAGLAVVRAAQAANLSLE